MCRLSLLIPVDRFYSSGVHVVSSVFLLQPFVHLYEVMCGKLLEILEN